MMSDNQRQRAVRADRLLRQCGFESHRGHVEELQKPSVMGRRLTVRAVYQVSWKHLGRGTCSIGACPIWGGTSQPGQRLGGLLTHGLPHHPGHLWAGLRTCQMHTGGRPAPKVGYRRPGCGRNGRASPAPARIDNLNVTVGAQAAWFLTHRHRGPFRYAFTPLAGVIGSADTRARADTHVVADRKRQVSDPGPDALRGQAWTNVRFEQAAFWQLNRRTCNRIHTGVAPQRSVRQPPPVPLTHRSRDHQAGGADRLVSVDLWDGYALCRASPRPARRAPGAGDAATNHPNPTGATPRCGGASTRRRRVSPFRSHRCPHPAGRSHGQACRCVGPLG
jgi:hypothetical protein